MNNLTLDEKIAILHWSSSSSNRLYRKIKKASHNKYLNTNYEIDENSQKDFEVIENMFNKYEDNTSHINIIYRTDIIENEYNIEMTEKELFDKFCSKFKINKEFILEEILCSFSTLKEVAIDTAKSNIQKYSAKKNTPLVTYTIKKDFLNICILLLIQILHRKKKFYTLV